jgi:hypothetical protein
MGDAVRKQKDCVIRKRIIWIDLHSQQLSAISKLIFFFGGATRAERDQAIKRLRGQAPFQKFLANSGCCAKLEQCAEQYPRMNLFHSMATLAVEVTKEK